MFLNVVTVFYLNQRDIRELVGVTLVPVVDVPPTTVASRRARRPCRSGRPTPQDADDLALLRQYEPILRFTHGEMFFPMPAERYLESAALLAGRSARELQGRHPRRRADEARLVADGETDQPRSASCASSRRR